MVEKLAEDIFANSIHFKAYNSKNLLLIKNRLLLEKELIATQELVSKLISFIQNNVNYTSDYAKLALFMYKTLSECVACLTSKCKNYRETVIKTIWGFHNLPRAFLPIESSMKITPKEAVEYYKACLIMN